MREYKQRIENGKFAFGTTEKLIVWKAIAKDRTIYDRYSKDLGFGFLLGHYNSTVVKAATPSQIEAATRDTIPNVAIAFWEFWFMFGFWGLMTLFLIF